MNGKVELRRWTRERSRALASNEICEPSARALRNLKAAEEFQIAQRVLVYLSFGNEVNT
ncbi:MAG: hypothetical protein IT445_17120 [Phycisphaeraceae bacterium]|nr:hypothetical protein [Phycisphaeraceae bacterium]